MYYIAAIDYNNEEMACDFGFDMLERIYLDECFKQLKEVPRDLIKEKRFCLYNNHILLKRNNILGTCAANVCRQHDIYLGYDTCCATVLDKDCLESTLKHIRIKLVNLKEWTCSSNVINYGLFDSVMVYDPYLMRSIMSEEKYGAWDYSRDQESALKVIDKFIHFLDTNKTNFKNVILYNEIFCSRWDCTGELCIDPSGYVIDYKYFEEGTAFSYLYVPSIRVWQRV
ncbi:MAG: hypothetical protein K9L17_08590 [Clostridiales bacterium]|nr:hypothetical protein [Clostridiales bacterium]MCF8022733.1 hypothetical protein [Clostridiales bacterium]